MDLFPSFLHACFAARPCSSSHVLVESSFDVVCMLAATGMNVFSSRSSFSVASSLASTGMNVSAPSGTPEAWSLLGSILLSLCAAVSTNVFGSFRYSSSMVLVGFSNPLTLCCAIPREGL